MTALFTGIIVAVLFWSIEHTFRPRLDVTRDNDLLLWYNKGTHRSCIKIL